MKIAMIGNSDLSIYLYRCELIERLLSDGHDVAVLSPNGSFIPQLESMGCSFYETELDRRGTNPIKDFGLILKYIKLLKNIKPDMVFSYTIKPNIYGAIACRLLNIPIVVNVTGLGTAVENKGWKQKVTLMLYRISFSKVQTIFFQNEENMQFFRDRKLYVKKHKLLPGSGVKWSDGDSDDRITKIGALLRKTRLDELPQLWSCVTGEMSLIGPRPEREIFYDAFEEHIHGFRQRLKVKPGITGLAQVSGGYDLRPEEKIVFDIEYIKKRSLWLEIKILFKTVAIVLNHKGAK